MAAKLMLRNIRILGVLFFGGLILLSPASLHAWSMKADNLRPSSVPTRASVMVPPLSADLKGDGQQETLDVDNGRATIFSGIKPVWRSPDGWSVVQAAFTDLDRDGRPEVTLVVFRAFKPWPVDQWLPFGGRIKSFHDAAGQSCHLILIGWRRNGYGEIWAGSALADPIRAFAAVDLDGDGNQELVTLEGRYMDFRTAPSRDLKIWKWNGFGFSDVSYIPGTFDLMALVKDSNDHILILVP
jgi:hypothetical protein